MSSATSKARISPSNLRFADDKLDRLAALAEELVRLNVNLLLTPAPPAALAAKSATRTIPIVFYNVGDPVADGLVDSLARPGGNITGVTTFATVLIGKQLEFLKETIPKLSRVGVLWNPQDPSSAQQWKESLHPARELRLQLDSMEVNTADKYEPAFKEALKTRSAAFVLTLHALANSNQKRIADLATKNRLPGIYPRSDFVASGGLMSYGADRSEPLRRAAVIGRQDTQGDEARRYSRRAAEKISNLSSISKPQSRSVSRFHLMCWCERIG